MDYYGLWSHVPLSAGVRFVAFCRGSSDDATRLLTEANCEQLVDPATALADTKAALDLDAKTPSSADIIASAARLAGQRGDIFARYIWAKVKPEAMNSLETFEALVRILEDPRTTERARESLLISIYEELGMADPPRRLWEVRLIQAMFRLLTLSAAKSLQATIEEVYLPNMLGLDGESPRYTAGEVFKDQVDARQRILSTLQHGTQSEFMPRLIQWLEAQGTQKIQRQNPH
jgi:hypothetical protein